MSGIRLRRLLFPLLLVILAVVACSQKIPFTVPEGVDAGDDGSVPGQDAGNNIVSPQDSSTTTPPPPQKDAQVVEDARVEDVVDATTAADARVDSGVDAGPLAPTSTGDWTGTWTVGTLNGGLAFTMDQIGDQIFGDATFTNSTCISTATIRGVRTGDEITADVTATGVALTLTAKVTTNGFTMSMSGSYSGQTGCGQGGGTFTATKGETHVAILESRQVVPPHSGGGYGIAIISRIDATSFKLRIYWTSVTPTALHLHFGSACGQAQSPNLLDLEYAGETSPYETEIINVTDADWDELRAGLWNFDVPSAAYPAGHVRGQFSRDDTVACPAAP